MKKSLLSKSEPQQRILVTFSRGDKLKYIAHLDMMRLWHRALRRAGMPLAYSQGFNPQARIAIAAPLAVGVTSEAELMDVFLQNKVLPDFFVKAVAGQLPDGIKITSVKDVWLRLPSLQSQLRSADYQVEVERNPHSMDVKKVIQVLLERKTLEWKHYRGARVHRYDLRALIKDIWVVRDNEQTVVLGMHLNNNSKGAGRPEQVLLALGFTCPANSIHRVRLTMESN